MGLPDHVVGQAHRFTGADDRARTGDLNLGKVALYQLSYVRGRPQEPRLRRVRERP
jgi:hypothetical protein